MDLARASCSFLKTAHSLDADVRSLSRSQASAFGMTLWELAGLGCPRRRYFGKFVYSRDNIDRCRGMATVYPYTPLRTPCGQHNIFILSSRMDAVTGSERVLTMRVRCHGRLEDGSRYSIMQLPQNLHTRWMPT